jgi:site-specific recombinase XerD
MLVSEAIEKFLKAKRVDGAKPATLTSYRATLRLLLDPDQDIEAVTVDDLLQRYLDLRERGDRFADHPSRPTVRGGLATTTLHKHVRQLKNFFNWLIDREIIRRNPARAIKRPRLPKAVPKGIGAEDLLKMIDAAQAMNGLAYAVVCVLAGTACRVGGLVALTLDDIHFAEHTVVLHEKGDKSREVHLPPRAAEALRKYIDEERSCRYGSAVFIGRRGPLTPNGIYLLLKRVAKQAGVSRFNPHAFRHGFVSYALKNGSNPKVLQEILGHSDVRTTLMIYGAMADREVLAAHEEIEFLPPVSRQDDGDPGCDPGRDLFVQMEFW